MRKRKWNRKCGIYGQLGNFDCSRGNNSTDKTFNSTKHLKLLIQGHVQWIQRYLDQGWDGYLFTVNFNDLPGKRDTKIIQMHQEVTRLYGRLATRMIRKPRSPKWARWLPIGIFICDMPVPKSRKGQKSTIADVSINDGLNIHGLYSVIVGDGSVSRWINILKKTRANIWTGKFATSMSNGSLTSQVMSWIMRSRAF
jgi:hypothetical protein